MTSHFCSVQFTDDDGEIAVHHMMLTEEQKQTLADEFSSRGIEFTIYDLATPQSVELAALEAAN